MLSLVCAFVLQAAAQAPFSQPIEIAEPNRLAITPVLDGKLDAEEWDPLTASDTLKTYFEWEPGILHVAARLPLGQDFVFSLDRESDGWLIGNDNLEVRVTLKDGKPSISARGLDGRGAEGPHWFEAPGWARASTVAASFETGYWTLELSLADPGVGLIPMLPSTIAIRTDTVPSDGKPTEAFLPRAMTKVNLVLERSAGMPTGLIWRPDVRFRAAVPGDNIRIRHTFKGNNDLKIRRLEMRTEADSKDYSTSSSVPFPDFDRKGRAYVDYNTKIEKGCRLGWFVQRTTLTTADGISSIGQTSFRVAPLLDFDMPKDVIPAKNDKRVLRFSVLLRSNSIRRVDGTLMITPPNGWRVLRGSDKSFIIPNPRGSSRRTFDLEIPGNAIGVYPIAFKVDLGGKFLEGTEWLNVVAAPK